ncbi:MAG: type VI secretion system contractile sheath large subunit, partial [Anaerolineales bacterium]
MAFMAPVLKFSVPNILKGAGEIDVHLSIRSLRELTPESIAAQVPELSGNGMASSPDPGLTSRAAGNQLALILEHEALVGLTRTWYGIHSLAREIQPGSNVQLRVMHMSRMEILKDFEKAAEFDQSSLFKKLYDREYGRFGGKPYDCIIADFDFDHTIRDVTLLSKLSNIAGAGHFVILASAAPALLQLKDWENLNPDFDAHIQMAANSYIRFRSLCKQKDSRYLFLTMPAAGSDDGQPDDSSSEFGMADKRVETTTSPITLSPSYLVAASIAKCFRETGWFVPPRIDEQEQKSEKRSECGHGEAFAGDSLSAKLSDLGLNRIQGAEQRRTLPTAVRSLYRPPAGNVLRAEELEGVSSLAYMSCANHIIHYVHSIWRDRCSFSKKSSDYFDVIMEWLNGLSTLEKDGTDLFAVTARALSESDYYMSNSQDMDRIELEFIRGFEPPGPKLQLLLFSADEARLRDVDVVVGVLMDLSRFSEQRLEADRKFVAVDTDNFDHVIRGKKCRLSFKVRNLLNGQGDLAVDLQVRTLDDLNPRQVAKQVIQLARLLKDRRSLAALAA